MFLACAALSGVLLSPQEPDQALLNRLGDRLAAERIEAALELGDADAALGPWILREARRGQRERQRALLLAAALMGPDGAWELLEETAQTTGRNRREDRAWALLLFGAFHPEAPARAVEALGWAREDFEEACLLAGLLAAARPPADVPGLRRALEKRRRGHPARLALLRVLETLEGAPLPAEPAGDFEAAGLFLVSVLPDRPAVPAAWVEAARGRVPEAWREAARRRPPRAAAEIAALPPVGDGAGVVFALGEVAPGERQALFARLRPRIPDAEVRAWLWGTAGALGLDLPEPEAETILPEEAAGLLELARVDRGRARAEAQARRARARASWPEGASLEEAWPAALVLALAGEEEDQAFLRPRVEAARGAAARRLQPLWQLARGAFGEGADLHDWLRRWSRELGGGPAGFLDHEGPRYLAWLLVRGSEGARSRAELQFTAGEGEGLWRDFDPDPENELYDEMVVFLFSGRYRWRLR